MTRLAVVGLGPVGLATSVAFAMEGHNVTGVDVNVDRISRIGRGESPFFEEGLEEALKTVLAARRFSVTGDLDEATTRADIVFLAVGTPSRPDGAMDDTHIREATRALADTFREDSEPIIVVKSTVVPGTTENVVRPILEASGKPFGLAVNPEFLREGHALEDSLHPDRIVLGVDGSGTARHLRDLYAGMACPTVETDLRTAEAIKYATNAYLAMKIAFADELANICQAFGVSYDEVIQAVTLDGRISPRFLIPGVGFGGSCLPKDLRALVVAVRAKDYAPGLFEAVLSQNEFQYLQAIRLLEEELLELKGKRIALLGLAFKGGTDDVRESCAIPIAKTLKDRGAAVVGYDPVANKNFARTMSEIVLAETVEDALRDADACLIQADWPEFSRLKRQDFLSLMRTPVVIDGRRTLEPDGMEGIRFRRIG